MFLHRFWGTTPLGYQPLCQVRLLHVQVDDGRGPSAAKAFAVGKAVALALMDRPAQQQCRQQVPINPAQNRLLADVVADDLLSSLLADLHARQHQVVVHLLWPPESIAYQFAQGMLDGSPMLLPHLHCSLVLRQKVISSCESQHLRKHPVRPLIVCVSTTATLPSLALQQPQLQASSSRPTADAKRVDWTAPQSQPRRDRPLSLELGATERQELALRSLSDAAADPRYGGRFSSKLVRETLKASHRARAQLYACCTAQSTYFSILRW